MKAGIHLVHKPVGPTSHSVVRAFIDELAARGKRTRICHGGTLDPFAHGLLLVLVGPATRLMEFLHPLPKRYVADIVWGAETENGDPSGRVVATGDASALTPAVLDDALSGFLGWHDQVPPATSAKRVGGERAYEKAHRGEEVKLPPSRVYLHSARFLSHELPGRSRLLLTCRGGYYVRSLARDLGRALGCRAHLAALYRSHIGPWEDPGPDRRERIHGERLLPHCAIRSLSSDELRAVARGSPILRGQLLPPAWALPQGFPEPRAPVRGLHDGRLVALFAEDGDRLRPTVCLMPGI